MPGEVTNLLNFLDALELPFPSNARLRSLIVVTETGGFVVDGGAGRAFDIRDA